MGTSKDSKGLITQPYKDLHTLNHIKRDPNERLRNYLNDLNRADPAKGRQRGTTIYYLVSDLVTKSFAPSGFPVAGDVTKALINERLDKCVELVLTLADSGWVSTRIIDELPRLFRNHLANDALKIPKRSSWGAKEDFAVELDYTEENFHE